MTNKASSFPAAPAIGPLRRHGGRITALAELPIHALADDYLVEGNGTVRTLPALAPGTKITLRFAGTPTFTNSTKLLCPGGNDYIVTPGDMAILRTNGDGAYRIYVIPANNGMTNVVYPPGGRLTLVSATPVFTTDQTAITSIWYAPVSPGNGTVPIFNGAQIQSYSFLSSPTDAVGAALVLGSNWAANTIYDCFFALNGGVPTFCTGPAWSNSGAGTSARATALSLYGGLQTNSTSMTARSSNSTTFTVAANQGTYVGSFVTNGSTGTIDFKFGSAASGGGAAVISIYNPYNQVLQRSNVQDSGATYTYTLAAYQQARASAGNQATILIGLAGHRVRSAAYNAGSNSTASGILTAAGVGLDSTNTNSAQSQQAGSIAVANGIIPSSAIYSGNPSIGLHVLARLEYSQAAGTTTWFGGSQPGIQANLETEMMN